ncbi:hypothetical protein ACFQVD_26445 [Streptosporangium amethystogenes subsp. fukuiense]|uniref:Tape measure protein n=1 Tax=Streptosporangium amethystogenes subsp. fukuiense TaxID=698418 RepID=A0ABW2T6E4_9ACTN
MGQAQKETTNLGRKMVETGASADRMRQRLEAATRALPKIEIDADSTPAEVKFAELRRQLESLADKKIGVDIDDAAARAELAQIERELEQLQRNEVNINVKADIGAALAELRAVDGAISKVNGRDARVSVDANVGGALAGIAMVGAALASLPAVTSIGVGVTALGSSFAAAGLGAASFAAVAVPSFGRVSEALKASESAAAGAGAATGGAGKSAAQAAGEVLQLEQAEKRLRDAQADAKQAQEDLTRAREDGRRALEDMNFSLDRSVLSQKDAALAVREAAKRLAEVNADPKADQLDRERAELSYQQALQRSEEQQVKTARAIKDTAAANKAGVKGTDEYRQAQENVVAAQDKVSQAEAQLKQLRLQQATAMSSAGGSAGGLKDAFADLSKQEKILAKDMKAFGDEYLKWQRGLQPDVLPAISQGLDVMGVGLKLIGPGAAGAGRALTGLGKEAETALRGKFWQDFFNDVNKEIPGAITSLGHIGGNVFKGFAGVIQALLPYGKDLLGNVENLSEGFAKWGTGLGSDSNFRQFMAEVKANGPQIWETLKNVAETGGNIVEALAPFGVGALGGLSLLAKLTADMSPEHIRGIALAVAAVYVAVNTGKGINAAVEGLGRLRDRMNDVGNAAGSGKSGIGGKLSGLAGMLGAGGPWGLAVGAGALVLGEFALANQEAAGKVRDLATALGESQGAMSAAFKEKIGAELIDNGAVEAARKLGINLETLRSAALGNKGAIAEVNAKLNEHKINLEGANAKAGAFAYGQKGLTSDAFAVRSALDGTNTTIAEARRQYAETTLVNAGLKDSYAETKRAIDAAGGSMDITKGKTGAQREAAELARQKFAELAQKVGETSSAQGILTGKTDDARKAFEEQIPKLFELAGKNKEAREEVYKLAQNFGISRTEADKAATKIDDVKSAADKLKDKKITIDADTKPAENAVYTLAKKLLGIKLELPVGIRAPATPKAYGGISHADGRQYMAAGGIRSVGSSPSAMIAKSPALISGRQGPDVVFGEAGWEAYIPLSPGKRGRGLEILGEAASAMGMAVVPQQTAVNTAGGSMAGGGGVPLPAGGAMVTVTGIGALKSSLDTTAMGLTTGLGAATSTLDAALGDAGTLTSSLTGVGEVAGHLAGEVAGWGEVIAVQVPPLTDAVAQLGTAISAAAAAAGDSKSGAGSKGDERSPRGGSNAKGNVGSKGDERSPRDTAKAAEPKKITILGATRGTVGVALTGGATNWSTTSRPVTGAVTSGNSSGPSSASGSTSTPSGSATSPGGDVHIYGLTVRSEADIPKVTAQISMRRRSRG